MSLTGWEITEWAVALAAFVTALGVLWNKVVGPLVRRLRKWAEEFDAWRARLEVTVGWTLQQMKRVEASTAWVEAQMKPNGGAHLVDKVTQAAHKATQAVEGVDRVEGLLAESVRDRKAIHAELGDVKSSLSELLHHDATRDTPGRRYGGQSVDKSDSQPEGGAT